MNNKYYMKNIYYFTKKSQLFLLKEVTGKTSENLKNIFHLRQNVWLNETNNKYINILDNIDVKDTTQIFVVENNDGKIIASASLSINKTKDDDIFLNMNENITHNIPFPHYYFRRCVVAKEYQRIGIGNELIKYRCNIVKDSNIKSAFTISSKKNLNNLLNHGFCLVENNANIPFHNDISYPLIYDLQS